MSIGSSFRRGFGEVQSTDDTGTVSRETFTCAHCNRVTVLAHRETPAVCMVELLPVCPRCHAKGTCVPFEKKMKAFEDRARFQRQLGV